MAYIRCEGGPGGAPTLRAGTVMLGSADAVVSAGEPGDRTAAVARKAGDLQTTQGLPHDLQLPSERGE